jgi:hypothetical protein
MKNGRLRRVSRPEFSTAYPQGYRKLSGPIASPKAAPPVAIRYADRRLKASRMFSMSQCVVTDFAGFTAAVRVDARSARKSQSGPLPQGR